MKSMRAEHLLTSFLAMARIGAAATLSQRAVLVGRALFYLLVIVILAMFWDVVSGQDATKPPAGIVLYVGVAECILLSVPALHLRLEDDIRSGAVEAYLLRPLPYLLCRVGEAIGGLGVRLVVLGLAGVAALVLSGRTGPPLLAWPLVMLLALLGGIVNVLLFAIVGLATFWIRRCLAAFLVMQKLTFLLGGLFAPVTLYPAWLSVIAKASPFGACLYWPSVMVMQSDGATVLRAFIAVLAWIGVLALLCGLVWQAGTRRLLVRGL